MTPRLTRFLAAACLSALSLPALGQSVSPSSLATIFEKMESSDLQTRNAASAKGRELVSEWIRADVATIRSLLPPLLKGLQSSDRSVRVSASGFFSLLGMFRADEVLAITQGLQERIVDAFDTEDDQIRANLMRCFALARPEPPAIAIPGFAKSAARPDSEPQRIALLGLMRAAGSDTAAAAVFAVVDGMADDPERMRAFLGLAALAKPEHPVILERLGTLLDHEDDSVAVDTISVLGAIGAPARAQLLALDRIAADGERSDSVRIAAREAGARIRREIAGQA